MFNIQEVALLAPVPLEHLIDGLSVCDQQGKVAFGSRAWEIFREAYKNVSGLARTVRGPSMSTNPGKVQVLGVNEIQGEKVFTLRFLQGRNPDWVQRPFFAAYNETACWLNELTPGFGEKRFFFEDELEQYYRENLFTTTVGNFE